MGLLKTARGVADPRECIPLEPLSRRVGGYGARDATPVKLPRLPALPRDFFWIGPSDIHKVQPENNTCEEAQRVHRLAIGTELCLYKQDGGLSKGRIWENTNGMVLCIDTSKSPGRLEIVAAHWAELKAGTNCLLACHEDVFCRHGLSKASVFTQGAVANSALGPPVMGEEGSFLKEVDQGILASRRKRGEPDGASNEEDSNILIGSNQSKGEEGRPFLGSTGTASQDPGSAKEHKASGRLMRLFCWCLGG